MRNKNKGFTLIEVLLVVGLIAILVAITIIAINPGKNFKDTRNTQRGMDVGQILNGVTQYTSEEGKSVDDLGTIVDCSSGSTTIGTTADLNLKTNLVPDYIVDIPMDPQAGSEEDTGYTICKAASSRVQVDAPNAEDKTISVKR